MLKIAAYCRVSTDKEDQANSFESQQRYFREYIGLQPDWELYEIYADEGISGTSTKNRTAFHRMLQDARNHRFDRILTKEVSRFSRNILDTITYTRELRSLDIGVVFLNDGIFTLDPDSELRLSIMGSLAQEESRRTSSRVKWGQTRRMEQGVVFGRSLLGYDVKNGKMTVNPEGAEIVRLIFHKYVQERKGTTVIARELEEAGYQTLTGRNTWRNTVVLKILKNEKYCGDLKQKKTITPDYLTHQKKYNRGEEAFIFLKDHHQPIVSREMWDAAQREIARRDVDGRVPAGHGSLYPLSGKILCSQCGRNFTSHSRRRKNGDVYKVWRCAGGTATGCSVRYQLRDREAMELVERSVNTLELDRSAFLQEMTRLIVLGVQASQKGNQARKKQLRKEFRTLQCRKAAMLDAFFEGSISQEDMELMNGEYSRRMKGLQDKLSALPQESTSADPRALEEKLRANLEAIVNGQQSTSLFYGSLLDCITAYPDRRLEVRLKLLPGKWVFCLG